MMSSTTARTSACLRAARRWRWVQPSRDGVEGHSQVSKGELVEARRNHWCSMPAARDVPVGLRAGDAESDQWRRAARSGRVCRFVRLFEGAPISRVIVHGSALVGRPGARLIHHLRKAV
jgi:hypothetical protein